LVPNTKKRKELPARMPHPETPPRKFLCRKRQASKSLKFQKGIKKGIPRRSRSTARNFHPGNST
jgi:hypothetical protein